MAPLVNVMRFRVFWAGLVLVFATTLVGCSGVQRVPQGDAARFALLEISSVPRDAEISIDDRYLGPIEGWRERTVPVKPGARRVMVSRDGYLPYLFDLKAESGRMYRLEVDLIRDPDTLDEPLDQD